MDIFGSCVLYGFLVTLWFHALQTKLQEVAVTHQEKISSAPVPIVEHFALVLGQKPNHSRGVGIRAVNRVAEERIRLQAQVEASEQLEAAAWARADAAEQRAEAAEQRAQAWKVRSRRWSKQIHIYKKSSKPNVMS